MEGSQLNPLKQADDATQLTLRKLVSFYDWLHFNRKSMTWNAQKAKYETRPRFQNSQGHRGKNTVAVGLRFPFQLLDIFNGAFAAMFLMHRDQRDFVWLESDTLATGLDPPEGTKFLAAVLYKYWPKALQHKWVDQDTAGSPLKGYRF